MAGSTLTLNQTVCDNDALGTANWDSTAEGHVTSEEEEEGSSGSWDYDFSDELQEQVQHLNLYRYSKRCSRCMGYCYLIG